MRAEKNNIKKMENKQVKIIYRIFTNNSPWGVINSECLRHWGVICVGVCGGS